ncbi:MAG: c-type cytochrome [Terracidiphilus sp.]
MKTASKSLSVAVAVFAAAAFALASGAQAPQTEPSAPPPAGAQGSPMRREIPAPKNLQVLPKDLTGEQVVHIMQGWAAALGTHCDTCHAPNPNAEAQPGRRPRLDFALDVKPEKNTARLMYKMVQDINTNYIAMVNNSGANSGSGAESGTKVSCGTCHRGHVSPPAFTPPERQEGPRPQGAQGSMPAPAPGL